MLARPSKRVVAPGFDFFYDRYALASRGLKLIGMQVRSGTRHATGYVFERAGHVFLGSHVMHLVLDADAFLDAMEKYDELGILVPTGADAEMALADTYHAYQLTNRRMNLRMLLGPMRSRMVGPWASVVLAEETKGDRRLASVWQSVSRDFRNDPVAKANMVSRVTVPTWFVAYWADRASAARSTQGRPRSPSPRSRVPRLPRRFTV